MFEIRIDDTKIKSFFNSLEGGLSDSEMSKIMEEAASYVDFKILERTSKGVDVNSEAFKAYAPLTVRLRREAGLPTNKPDLFFTGQMLNAMTHDSSSEEGRIFFMGGASSPSPTEKMLKNNPIRPFFGVSEEDQLFVEDIVIDHINRIIDG